MDLCDTLAAKDELPDPQDDHRDRGGGQDQPMPRIDYLIAAYLVEIVTANDQPEELGENSDGSGHACPGQRRMNLFAGGDPAEPTSGQSNQETHAVEAQNPEDWAGNAGDEHDLQGIEIVSCMRLKEVIENHPDTRQAGEQE